MLDGLPSFLLTVKNMPEIAEVERARRRIHRQVLNFKITHVDTVHDDLVYSGIEHSEFAQSILNKTLVDTQRRGKYFVLLLDQGPHIVAHLGMTGGLRFEHEEKTWPPKYWKLQILFTLGDKKVQFGFKDPRRIARLRLVQEPLTSEPISRLGFDPILSMPPFDRFCALVGQRSVPLKVLLLDQSFSAGVGNWVADEVLFQSKIHPAQYTHTLTPHELRTLYDSLRYVCQTAVDVEADEEKFPTDWLMKYRWNKGRGLGKGVLPDGQVLKFETIGGRTTAYSPSRQILRITQDMEKRIQRKLAIKKETVLSEKTNRKDLKVTKKTVKKEIKTEDDDDLLFMPETKVFRERCTTKYNLRQMSST